MKIAQIVCAYPPYAGGIANSAKQIHDLLLQSHSVENFHPGNTKTLIKRGHAAFLPQLLWKLRHFDYIYLHYPFFGAAEVVWLFKIFNKKTKLIIHYHMDVKNESILNKILSLPSRLTRTSLLKQADTIVSASLDYVKHSNIKNFYAKHPQKFQEIPFSLNINKFCPKEINQESSNPLITKTKNLIKKVNELYIKRNRLDLIFIGGLDSAHYFKGIPVLLNALANLDDSSWRLNIIGDGNLKAEYLKLAKDLQIDKNISFLGKLENKEFLRSLQEADVLVLPSINSNEAFGIVLIEALACGVPVIASNLPGVRSVFKDGVEGLLVEPGDSLDLKLKIEWLLNNEALRQEMAKRARVLALQKYNDARLEELYEDLLNK